MAACVSLPGTNARFDTEMENKPRHTIVQTVKEYGKKLFRFIRGRVDSDEDAEDILQEVWYQLSNVLHLEEIEQMSGWLHRVARNKIIDKYRRPATGPLEESTDDEDGFGFKTVLLADATTPETAYLKDVFWNELLAALDALPEAQRQVFVWNELDGLTLQQIADKTGENLKTIISRKGYAVKQLRKKLETIYNEILYY